MAAFPEVVLSWLSLFVMASAFCYLTAAIRRKHAQPRFVWLYTWVTLLYLLVLRVLGVAQVSGFMTDDVTFLVWRAALNQAGYVLLGFAIILMIRAHIVGMRHHWRGPNID